MLSGNGQAGPIFEVVDAGLAGIHYDANMDPPAKALFMNSLVRPIGVQDGPLTR